MRRVSSGLSNNDVQYNLRLQETRLNKVNNQMGSQQRIQSLRDDPIAAGHLVRYQSYAGRIETFKHNAQTLTDQYAMSEGYMNNSLQILQRVRDLAVTGANGVYTKEDMANMAVEVDQLLQELIQNANAKDADGNALFAGNRSKSAAFTAELGNTKGTSESLVQSVRYNGSISENNVEVDEQTFMSVDRTGNKIFWAEPQQLFSQRDASAYQVMNDSTISINGIDVDLKTGDNMFAIAAKINDSGAPVKAGIDPITKGLMIHTTDARQLWLEDSSGSTLQDLGIIKDKSQRPPFNLGDSVRVSGGSMFDSVIALRNALLSGDSESVGGKVLGSLDSALNNLVTNVADLGSRYERAVQNVSRAETTALNVTSAISREGDLDFTKAITDMKMLEYVKNATLSTAGKLYSSSLLNYIR
ncbi:MAG TPA: flagellar hook-associated protein 3 [Treponemataceae bacterium]|nr:flagellar hook-associated protein 3 [Treponemataceae bacterium]